MGNLLNVKRYDYGTIQTIERTPQGFLKVPGFATRTGVFTYRDASGAVRRELRHPDDVFAPESLITMKNLPVTLEHPPAMVTPENVTEFMKGYTTDRVEVNRDLVDTDVIIADAEAIEAVETKQATELSCGYLADIEEESGVFNGAAYDCRQKNIRHNHLAIVRSGRGGPEVRLRLDSKDAVMTDDLSGKVNEEKPGATKKVVFLGDELELPAKQADALKALLDRYDEMRAKSIESEDEAMAVGKKDVDISQKGVSPKPDEQQLAPDGRGASKKVAEGDTSGVNAARGLKKDEEAEKANGKDKGKEDEDEMDEDEEKKKDDELATGAEGVAENPIEAMKREMSEMKDKYDAMQAKMDEYASATMNSKKEPVGGEKMDSKDFDKRVRARVKLESQAAQVVPNDVSQKFDSLKDDEIRAAVIKFRHPSADLAGKSTIYLQTRFDSIVESIEESNTVRKEMGLHLLRTDSSNATQADPGSARSKMISETRNLWQQSLSASKK